MPPTLDDTADWMNALNLLGAVAQEGSFSAYVIKVGGAKAAQEQVATAIMHLARLFAMAKSAATVDLESGRAQLYQMNLAATAGDWERLHELTSRFLETTRIPFSP